MRRLNDIERNMHELVLNWKLRLVASSLLSMLGLTFFISFLSGLFYKMALLDQTIEGVAIFVVMIPVYLIIADLPKINEYTIASMLNDTMPELDCKAELVLKSESDLTDEELAIRRQIEPIFKQEKLYKFLPNRPIKQAVILLTVCLAGTGFVYLFLV